MSRPYPLDPIPDDEDRRVKTTWWLDNDGFAIRSASAVARWLLEFGDWRLRHHDLSRAITSAVLFALGLLLIVSAGITDIYLHRGVESGTVQPYVVQPTSKGLATNIDLRGLEDDDRQSIVSAIASAGFIYVRQPISWQQLEPERGQYVWDDLAAIVATLQRYDLTLIVVVTGTPEWARQTLPSGAIDGPPDVPEDFGTFLTAMTDQFQEQLPFIQIWDRPNDPAMWGGEIASGQDFISIMAAGFNGAKLGYRRVRIISPELMMYGPTSSSSPSELTTRSDLGFTQELYRQGGDDFFDILGIRLDGGSLSPDDRRINHDRQNFSRAVLFRELMLREGDDDTPIWATSFGWAASQDVSRGEQAEYVARGLERSWSEWPWMGLAVQWTFIPRGQFQDESYAVILSDGNPTPLYQRLIDQSVAARSGRGNTGFSPMDAGAVSYSGRWQDQDLEGRTFRTTSQVGSSTTFQFQGTGLIAFIRSGPQVGDFTVEIDGEPIAGGSGEDGLAWSYSIFGQTDDLPHTLVSGLDDGPHTVTIVLVSEGELTIGGFEVERDAPFVWPVILMTIGAMITLFFGLRSLAYLVATRTGHLQRQTSVAPSPALPQLPNWRPVRRT